MGRLMVDAYAALGWSRPIFFASSSSVASPPLLSPAALFEELVDGRAHPN